MMRNITAKRLDDFKRHLQHEEKSMATIGKYMHDVTCFLKFLQTWSQEEVKAEVREEAEAEVTKEATLAYKKWLSENYAITSANSMLAAMNTFLQYAGWQKCCVKQFRVQKKVYCPEERELSRGEYQRLLNAAKQGGNRRLHLLLQTICATGIRVSELEYITVESLEEGEVTVSCKGKSRVIFLIPDLRKKLRGYARHRGINKGAIFVSKNGKPLHRSNIWREMKALCTVAKVLPDKVFPHNLRHLFARCYYKLEKDIAQLADVLGHTNINTTRIYIMSTGSEHKKKMERLRLII